MKSLTVDEYFYLEPGSPKKYYSTIKFSGVSSFYSPDINPNHPPEDYACPAGCWRFRPGPPETREWNESHPCDVCNGTGLMPIPLGEF